MQQGRWVSYIFRYRDDVKCENAGFVKIQHVNYRGNDELRMQIGMKMYKKIACRCRVYLIYEREHAKYMTDIYFKAEERDTIMKRVEVPWDNPLGDGRAFEKYDGILIVCDDGELLTGMWCEYEVAPGQINLDSKIKGADISGESVPKVNAPEMNVPEMNVPEMSMPEMNMPEMSTPEMSMPEMNEPEVNVPEVNVPEVSTPEEAYACEEQEKEDVCVKMLHTCPRLPLFADSPFLECVKIVPQDIGRLAVSNWKLGVNSFLSHGYYRYRYLMLGRVNLDEKERYVIGVPGVFTNKEKYLANMFGFSLFIPVKRTNVLTGNFGYWISEVLSE